MLSGFGYIGILIYQMLNHSVYATQHSWKWQEQTTGVVSLDTDDTHPCHLKQ